jgi:hypothetical protein
MPRLNVRWAAFFAASTATLVAGPKIFSFLGLFGSKIAVSPFTKAKIVHSQARVTCHLILWLKHYSISRRWRVDDYADGMEVESWKGSEESVAT